MTLDVKKYAQESAAKFAPAASDDLKAFMAEGGDATKWFECKLTEIMAFYTFAFRDHPQEGRLKALMVLDALIQASYNNVASGLLKGAKQ